MRATLLALTLVLPALSWGGTVATVHTGAPRTGANGLPNRGQVQPINLTPGSFGLNPIGLSGVLNLPGMNGPVVDKLKVPGVMNFAPEALPALPESVVNQAHLEQQAFFDNAAPMDLSRMVPPGGPSVTGNTFAPLVQQSANMTAKQTVVAQEVAAAANAGASGAEGALAFGDRVWDALLGRTQTGSGRVDWRPDYTGFVTFTGRSATTLQRSRGAAAFTPAETSGAGSSFASAPGVGTDGVDEIPGLGHVAVGDPSAEAGATRQGAAPRVFIKPIPRVLLAASKGALTLSYATVPGYTATYTLTQSALPKKVVGAIPVSKTQTPAVVWTPASAVFGPGAGPRPVHIETPVTLSAGEAAEFSYIQSAGQALEQLSPVSSPSQSSSSLPVSSVPLWAFPASALLPLLALALLTQREG